MRRLALMLVLPASMLLIAPALASSTPESLARIARTSVIAPTDWDGIWTTQDSIYSCAGAFQSTSVGADTICGGLDYTPGIVELVCTGTADATTIDANCTGTVPFITDCDANYTVVTHGTRNAGTSFFVTTVNITYTGTACLGLPPTCIQVNSYGTRLGPAPAQYCGATPTRRTTWGEIKALYR